MVGYLRDISIIVFGFSQVIGISVLVIDYLLIYNGVQSITSVSKLHPAIPIAITLLEMISPISLALHFYWEYQSWAEKDLNLNSPRI